MKRRNTRYYLGVLLCLGAILLFTYINYNYLKGYYDEKYNSFNYANEDLNEKITEENQKININQLDIEPLKIKLNSKSALLMDGDNNRVLYGATYGKYNKDNDMYCDLRTG